MNPEEMAARVRRQIETEVPRAAIEGEQWALYALGVVPPDFDLLVAITQLMGSELAGFYDPNTDTMYLGAGQSGLERHATLAHELVHALQDQHFDLGTMIDHQPDAGDRLAAVHALAEGDATSAMFDVTFAGQGSALDLSDDVLRVQMQTAIALSEATADVPSILKRSVIVPYVDGLSLVHRLRRAGGWGAVDALWREPPTTTEQVLHPDKLLSREPAEIVPIPPPPGSAAALPVVHHDIYGEQALRLVLEEWLPAKTAASAAAGWAGDRLAVFGDTERHAFAWHLRFDTVEDAEEAFEALIRGLGVPPVERRQGARPISAVAGRSQARVGAVCHLDARRGPVAVTRRAREVVVVRGPFLSNRRAATADASCASANSWAARVAGHN